jgi:hypothetical protein
VSSIRLGKIALYKGISQRAGLMDWPVRNIGEVGEYTPGFLSTYDVAAIYSEPSLDGPDDQHTMIIRVELDVADIEDRTEEYLKWLDENDIKDPDISVYFPPKWRMDNKVWTVVDSGSGHYDISCYTCDRGDASFIYCGKPIQYEVVEYYENQEEWSRGQG